MASVNSLSQKLLGHTLATRSGEAYCIDSEHSAERQLMMPFAVLDLTRSGIILLLVFTWTYRFHFLSKLVTLSLET